jgi:hypothetical protein
VAQKVPPAVIAITLGMYQAARAGEFAAIDPALADVLGRSPTTLRAVLAGLPSGPA